MAKKKRLKWIDSARGFCMMAILLFHSEVYFTGEEIIPYNIYVCNSLITFFFISGYLFHNPQKPFSLRRKLLSVAKGILLPYFIFTTAIAVPKSLVHADLSMLEAFKLIITGHASWFVATLVVAETIMAVLLKMTKGKKMVLFAACVLPYLAISVAYHYLDNTVLQNINFWCWQNALMVLIFMFVGFQYNSNGIIDRISGNKTIAFLAIAFVLFKTIVLKYDISMTLQPINITSFSILLADGIIGALLILAVCKRLPEMKLVEYTGKNSLYYYFICGGVPLIISALMHRAGLLYDGNYLKVIVVFITVYLTATAIVYTICKSIAIFKRS